MGAGVGDGGLEQAGDAVGDLGLHDPHAPRHGEAHTHVVGAPPQRDGDEPGVGVLGAHQVDHATSLA
ncbi:hypothetical protein GCM10023203_49410 [Actinomycetospora straminea]|uniref:Uncharacterized protein n=1 Tax=Actinomycetospora straminea TaxID=663607 RepID=A0ABP9EZA0_9PSEU